MATKVEIFGGGGSGAVGELVLDEIEEPWSKSFNRGSRIYSSTVCIFC